jgi:hypothetical protein
LIFRDSQDPYDYGTQSYDFDPTDPDNLEKLEEKFFEEKFDTTSLVEATWTPL